ncbi:MAG: hypothetical protein ABIJ09_24440 [Pseudomonadota bacterium]
MHSLLRRAPLVACAIQGAIGWPAFHLPQPRTPARGPTVASAPTDHGLESMSIADFNKCAAAACEVK